MKDGMPGTPEVLRRPKIERSALGTGFTIVGGFGNALSIPWSAGPDRRFTLLGRRC